MLIYGAGTFISNYWLRNMNTPTLNTPMGLRDLDIDRQTETECAPSLKKDQRSKYNLYSSVVFVSS